MRTSYLRPSARFEKTHGIIEDMLLDGYYALRRGDTADIDFIRISRPKKGALANAFQAQTQHSDQLRGAMVHYEYKKAYRANGVVIYHPGIDDKLFDVLQTLNDCRKLYAKEKVRCFRCGKKLTQARSRWYGFGPECENSLAAFKQLIEDEKGCTFEEAPVEIDF
jgi:hypothetical protein